MLNFTYNNKKSIEEIEKLITTTRKNLPGLAREDEVGIFIHEDNFDAMCRLLDCYEGKVDLVYIDPPFNTNGNFYYGDDSTATISSSKKDRLAYSDKMNLDEYIEFLRERLVLIRKLLSDQGTLYFHIDSKVGHYVKITLDEIFGATNFVNDITRIKSNPKNFKRKAFGNQKDVIYIYAKNFGKQIFNDVTEPMTEEELASKFPKIDPSGRRYNTVPCHAPGETLSGETGGLWKGMLPPKGRHWRCNPSELDRLDSEGQIEWSKNSVPRIKKFADQHQGKKIQDVWLNFKDPQYPIYPTEKNGDMLDLIVNQSSKCNSVVMDCFAGSSSFLVAGIKFNRYVIGIDKSSVAKAIIETKRKELKDIKILDFLT